MIPDRVWEILEEQEVVPKPHLPTIDKIVTKARDKRCSIQLNYPSDPAQDVLAVVSRHGSTFTSEQEKAVEALAVALAECLTETEPVQTSFMDEETPKKTRTRRRTIVDDVEAYVDGLPSPDTEVATDPDPETETETEDEAAADSDPEDEEETESDDEE